MATTAAFAGYIFIGIAAAILVILNCVAIGVIATEENGDRTAIQLAEAAAGAGIIIYLAICYYAWSGVHNSPQNKIQYMTIPTQVEAANLANSSKLKTWLFGEGFKSSYGKRSYGRRH
jgi:hypothetical protein